MHSSAEQIRVLVVDDHAGVREGIRAVVDAEPDMVVVGEAADGGEAIREFRRLLPSVTLADVNLSVVCGIEVVASIRAEFPQARIIVISALNEEPRVKQAVAAGALAFLHKDQLRRELLPAIRVVNRGEHYVPRPVQERDGPGR